MKTEKVFFYSCKTGKTFFGEISEEKLLTWENEADDNEIDLHEFIKNSEIGDKWETAADRIIRTK